MDDFDFLTIATEDDFNRLCLKVFAYQYQHNSIYREYCTHIRVNPQHVSWFSQIPFLPIEFFKSHRVVSGIFQPELTFTSSGTTGSQTSSHFVKDAQVYNRSFLSGFEVFYGAPEEWCILALLPNYLERSGSSLVYMTDALMKQSKHPQSGFYLYNYEALHNTLTDLKRRGQKTMLLGVTFALLEFADQHPLSFPDLVVMETGGMKGRGPELVRAEVHARLQHAFGLTQIHSEYGMTELLSQAYSVGSGIFQTPPWMRVLIRDANDPLALNTNRKAGGINVIDLANIHSCSFIATQDLGKASDSQRFEVLGRFDQSEMRGCNLLISL